jgi:hypothetical protein
MENMVVSLGIAVIGGGERGFRLGSKWPVARLVADESGIAIRLPCNRYYLDRDAISAVLVWKNLVADRVQIVHTAPDSPPFVVFWSPFRPLRPHVLPLRLKRLGYPLLDPVGGLKAWSGWDYA